MDADRPGDPAGGTEHPDGHPEGHLGDLVADLAGGSLGDADPALVLDHLAECEHCRAELADSVVAAAALRELALSPLVDHVALDRALVDPAPVDPAPAPHHAPPGRPAEKGRSAPRAGRGHRVLVAAAVLTALAVFAGAGVALGRSTAVPPSAAPTVTSPAGTGTAPGGRPDAAAATVVRLVPAGTTGDGATVGVGTLVLGGEGTNRRMALFAVGLADPGQGRVYEVWLGGPDPLAVGALDGAGSGSWVMPVTVAAGHHEVLVVRQQPGATVLAAGAVVATARLS